MTTARIIRSIPVGGRHLCGLTFWNGLLWFSDGELELIQAVEPSTGKVEQRLPCAAVRTGLTVLEGNLLQVVGVGGKNKSLRSIDPESGRIVAEFANPHRGTELCGIEATSNGIWMGYSDLRTVELTVLTEPAPRTVVPVGRSVAGLTVVRSRVLFAQYPTGQMHVADPAAGAVIASIELEGNPTGTTWDGALLWYCDYRTLQLRAIELPAHVLE